MRTINVSFSRVLVATFVVAVSIAGAGSDQVTVPYAGPALEAGMIYQYRATSVKTSGGGGEVAIAATEEFKGTFLFSP